MTGWTMKLDTPIGTRVRFTAKHGLRGQQDTARKIFVMGALYTVKWLDISGFHSTVELIGVEGKFNTCLFENV